MDECPNNTCDAKGWFPPAEDDPEMRECPACGATWGEHEEQA